MFSVCHAQKHVAILLDIILKNMYLPNISFIFLYSRPARYAATGLYSFK